MVIQQILANKSTGSASRSLLQKNYNGPHRIYFVNMGRSKPLECVTATQLYNSVSVICIDDNMHHKERWLTNPTKKATGIDLRIVVRAIWWEHNTDYSNWLNWASMTCDTISTTSWDWTGSSPLVSDLTRPMGAAPLRVTEDPNCVSKVISQCYGIGSGV